MLPLCFIFIYCVAEQCTSSSCGGNKAAIDINQTLKENPDPASIFHSSDTIVELNSKNFNDYIGGNSTSLLFIFYYCFC